MQGLQAELPTLRRPPSLRRAHPCCTTSAPAPAAGSSQANPFACVASGIAALWGPAHGGANEAVLKVTRAAAAVQRTGGHTSCPLRAARPVTLCSCVAMPITPCTLSAPPPTGA